MTLPIRQCDILFRLSTPSSLRKATLTVTFFYLMWLMNNAENFASEQNPRTAKVYLNPLLFERYRG